MVALMGPSSTSRVRWGKPGSLTIGPHVPSGRQYKTGDGRERHLPPVITRIALSLLLVHDGLVCVVPMHEGMRTR